MSTDPVPAAQAITPDTVGDLPRETPRAPSAEAHGAASPPAAAPAAAPAQGQASAPGAVFDASGESFDPLRHEPTRRKDGRWKRLRGGLPGGARSGAMGWRAQRRARLAGIAGAAAPVAAPPAAESSRAALPAPEASPADHPDGARASAPASDVRIVEPAAVESAAQAAAAGPDDYRETAEAITEASFVAAEMGMDSDAWRPSDRERRAWVEAWQATLAKHQAPKAGPEMRLVVLLVSSIAKRRSDPPTRRRVAGLWAWLGGLFRRRAPVAPPAAPAPATTSPAAPAAEPAPIAAPPRLAGTAWAR
jgi:hypothetical protein